MMEKAISISFIEDKWEAVNKLNETEAEQLVNIMGEEQPFLLAYLVGTGEGDLNEEEGEFLLYVGVILWEIFRKTGQKLTSIDEQTFNKIEETNLKMLEYLETESETYFFEFVKNLVADYPQPHLLQFIIELIFDEEEDIRDKNRGIIFMYLKIVIDCLEETFKKLS